jgi:hypothetical protein
VPEDVIRSQRDSLKDDTANRQKRRINPFRKAPDGRPYLGNRERNSSADRRLMIYRPGYLILQWFNPKATIEPERLLTFLCGLGFWSAIGVIVWGIALF